MKLRLLFQLLAIAVGCFLVGFGAKMLGSVIHPGPVVSVDQASFDLGDVPVTTKQRHEFVLANPGTAPLGVKVDSVSCTCTVADAPREEILPGQTRPLTAEIRPPEREGDFGADIVLTTNDSRHSRLVLSLHGHAKPILVLEPERLYFGSLAVSDLPVSRLLTIKAGALATKGTISSAKLSSDDAGLWVETNRGESQATVGVTLTNEASIGILRKNLIIKIHEPIEEEFDVPIIAEIRGTYHASPSGVIFGRVQTANPISRECALADVPPEAEVSISIDAGMAKRLQVTTRREDGGMHLVATLTPRADDQAPIDGEIHVRIQSPKHTENLALPVVAIFH